MFRKNAFTNKPFFQKYHDTFCCSSKILQKHCFQFLLGRFLPREIENNAYSKFLRDGNKEDYGIFEKGVFLTCTSPKMHLVWPPKFCLSIVFYSLGTAVIRRKNEKQSLSIFYLFYFFGGGGGNKVYYGKCANDEFYFEGVISFYLFSIYSIIYLFIDWLLSHVRLTKVSSTYLSTRTRCNTCPLALWKAYR